MFVHLRRSVVFFLVFLGFTLLAFSEPPGQIRVSLPPVMGSLPIALANGWGLFPKHGVDVEVIGLSDNQARSLALMAGDIDGMVCDLTTAVLLYTSGTDIVITSTAYKPEQTGSLALLSQSYFNITSIDDLLSRTARGSNLKSIAITSMSDIEYDIDKLMEHLGYKIDPDKDYSYWYDLLQVATFLSLGSVYAAVLPEPYITYISNYPSLMKDSHLVHLSDFEGIDLLPSVIVFRRDFVNAHPDLVERFYDAYRDAVERINSSTREELIAIGIDEALSLFFPGMTEDSVPEGIMNTFVIPHFPPPGMVPRGQFEDVIAWVNAKRYTWKHPTYEELTTDQFVK